MQPPIAPTPPAVNRIRHRMLPVIPLVILLRSIERTRAHDLRHDRPRQMPAADGALRRLRVPLLRAIAVEDLAAILFAPVTELAARVQRIDIAPEDPQQRRISDPLRIELHL